MKLCYGIYLVKFFDCNRLRMRARIVACVCGLLLVSGFLFNAEGQAPVVATNAPVTNILQIVRLLTSRENVARDVQLEATVCAASDPAIGVVILQDPTDTELFQLDG